MATEPGARGGTPNGGTGRRKRVGILDVAREAGVSQSTASDALNDTGRVDPRTRERIRDIAARLGYRANRNARMLRGGRSGILSLLNSLPAATLGELSSLEYQTHLMLGATTRALSHGYAVVTLPLDQQPAEIDNVSPDGVVLVDPTTDSGVFEWLEQTGTPMVTTGRLPDRPRDAGWWVDNDLTDGARRMFELLERRGARRIALLSNPPTRSYSVDALTAYEAWCAGRRMQPRVALTVPVATEDSAHAAALEILREADPPDAIYAPLERQAMGALRAARDLGLDVPGDVLLAVGSDSEGTRASDPGITALDLRPDHVGKLAIDLLVEQVEHRDAEPRRLTIEAAIIERGSTLRL
jgi:DNA-binding LacI/PurR family transcriptional regulator